MYIRIQDNSIKFRISREEAALLINNNIVSDVLILSEEHSLTYQIIPTQNSSRFYNEKTNLFTLEINPEKLVDELEGRPSKMGIEITDNSDNSNLKIFLQIDLKKIRK